MRSIVLHRSGFTICSIIMLYGILSQDLCAQHIFNGVVKGIVVDDSTNAPLPFANIFIANSTIGTVADIDGKYQLNKVPYGIHQIVGSIVGYTPQIITISMIDTKEKVIEFRLKPRNVQFSSIDVEGSDPKEWKRNLQKFIEQFLGTTSNASQCKLLNPEVLDFAGDEMTSEFTATVSEPLIIENKALGYRLHYYLKYFQMTKEKLRFFGIANYVQLHADSAEEIERWKINRQNAYKGSLRHFISTLFNKNSKEEGFQVRSIPKKLDFAGGYSRFGVEVDPDTLLTDNHLMYEKKLSYPDILQIFYRESIFNIKMSLFKLDQQSITIYSNGEIAEPLGILTYGKWSNQRAAEFLPSNYEP
jgi:CarboxypepD_reg-like domain